jgi:hypothetical protein
MEFTSQREDLDGHAPMSAFRTPSNVGGWR